MKNLELLETLNIKDQDNIAIVLNDMEKFNWINQRTKFSKRKLMNEEL